MTGKGGTTGAAGTTGSAGTTGAAGTTGNAGATGAAGTTGSAGSIGTTGGAGTTGSAGTTGAAGGAGTTGVAGVTGTAGRGGTTGGAGTTGAAGSAGNAGTTGAAGRGGTTGVAGRGGTTGSAGRGGTTGTGGTSGTGGSVATTPLDCGAMGTALENHGPPSNRLNYVIVADGYSQAELAAGGTLDKHLQAFATRRFSENAQPYLRYRNFINICVLRIASTPICGSSKFGCCGDDQSRLANCNTTTVNQAITQNLPASFEVDFRAVVLNGNSWWNSGGTVMMWSGGNTDGPGAALHEGGHGHNQLADEYDACEQSRVSREAAYGVNVSLMNGSSGGKFDGWIGYNQTGATGTQNFFACTGGATWRSSSNSMMNQLFCGNSNQASCTANTAFNSVSREKIVMDIWRAVQQPYDSVEPPAGAVTNPAMLKVNVIDPAVINVNWSVDGNMVAANGGPTFNVGSMGLTPGAHTITARAYDNAGMDLVRQVPGTMFYRQYWGSGAMGHSDKTVTWTVTIQ